MFSPSFFDQLEDRLNLAVFDINESHRMGLREIKQALRGHPKRPDVHLAGNPKGYSLLTLPGQEIEIGPKDTAQQIRAKLGDVTPTEALARVDAAVSALVEQTRAEPPKPQENASMGLADRLKEKALRARAVTANAVKELEDGMDSIIAEETAVKEKKAAALAVHHEALGVVKGQWDDMKAAVDILSNEP